MVSLDLDYSAAFSPPPVIMEPSGRRGSEALQRVRQPVRTTSGSAWHEADSVEIVTSLVATPLSEYREEQAKRHRAQFNVQLSTKQRIQELKDDAELAGDPISESSIRDFQEFMKLAAPTRRPSIFLLHNGNVRALWLNDQGEQVGLQFMGDGEIQFVMFVRRAQIIARDHGTEELSAMLAKIRNNGCMHLLA